MDQEFTSEIKKFYSEIINLTHRRNSDSAYYKACELAKQLHTFLKDSDASTDNKILNKYKLSDTDKSKDYIIKEFVKETSMDLRNIMGLNKM